jgi:hypothetical protein
MVLKTPVGHGHLEPDGTSSTMYTGISGGSNHPTFRDKAGSPVNGIVSWGGVIVVGNSRISPTDRAVRVRVKDITDGTSKTMMIGEQSDWCLDNQGQPHDCRSDCNHGFMMGFGNFDGTDRHFNTSCVHNRVGDKSLLAQGVNENCGPNRTIQSAHPAGAHVALADGSVRFVVEEMTQSILLNLANRDDGQTIVDGSY